MLFLLRLILATSLIENMNYSLGDVCSLFVSIISTDELIYIILYFRVQEHGGEPILPFSCAFEQKLVDMPEDEAAKYCAENQITRQVNSHCYT